MKKLFRRFLPACILAFFCLHLHSLNAQNIYYNAGGAQYISLAGDTFVTDLFYTPSATSTYTNPTPNLEIANTDDDVLYRSERSANANGGSFGYNIAVPSGTYKIQLHFAEIFFGATGGHLTPPFTGKRVFDVSIEGNLVLDNYDINVDVGPMAAVIKEFDSVAVNDANLEIDFASVTNKAKISAISIIQLSVAPPDSNNTAPTFTISGDVTADEDFAGTQTVTVTPDSVPPAEAGQIVSYSLNPPSVAFANVSINPSSGLVSITKVNNGNGSQLFTITANDGQVVNNIATQTFTLTVNAVNDAPAFTTSGNVTVNENFAGTQTVTVTPAAVPADEAGQTVVYSLSPESVAFANVSIDSSTGQVSITSVADAFGSQLFTITANDGESANNIATQNFTLTVTDTTDTPVEQDAEAIFYNAGGAQYISLANDTFIPDLNFTPGNTSTYTNPTANLAIANTDDDVLYRTERSASVNGGSFGYNIPVQNGLYKVQLHFAEIFYGATGGNLTQPFTGKRVFDVSIEGNLVLDNYDINADVGPIAAVIKEYDSVAVNDANLDIDFASVTNKAKISAISIIPLSIAPPDTNNTAPTFTISGDVTVDEDFAGTQNVTVTADSVPPAEAGQIVSYSLNPPTVAFANVSINPSTGLVSITKVDNGNGSQLFTITANDGQGANNIATQNFTLTVNAVNDAPAFTTSGNVAVNENFAGTQTVTVTPNAIPADEVGQAVVYSLSPESVAFANVSIDSITGQVSITSVADAFGSQLFTITANDGQPANNIATQNFTLTVNDTTDTPAEQDAIYFNCGGPQYISLASDTFITDLFYSSGTTTSSNNIVPDILGTDDDALYRTERFKNDFTYNIPVENGAYTVKLHFAEIFFGVAGGNLTPPFTGKRVFDVVLEGDSVLKNYDINADVGPGTAVIKEYNNVQINDGTVTIHLKGVVNNPKISAISIEPANETPNTPPTVSITAPTEGASFIESSAIQIDADADDTDGNISKVEFYENGNLLHTDFDFPYSFTWNSATPGGKALTAKAFDNDNATAFSDTVNITVTEDLPPGISIISPADGENFSEGANILIEADANDDVAVALVEFYEGLNLLGSDSSAPYTFNWNSVPAGNYSLTAKAFDSFGNETTSGIIIIHVAGDVPPTVSITSPADGATFIEGTSTLLEADANDDVAVTHVEFYEGLNLLGSDSTFPYSFLWNNIPAGVYSLTAKAFDTAANETTSTAITVTYETDSPPSVAFTSPNDGATFIEGASILLEVDANDDVAVTHVEFYEGLNLLGTDNSFPYSFNWIIPAIGNYSLTAKAFDNSLQSTTSAPIAVEVVADVPPSVSITAPTEGTSFTEGQTIVINATASDDVGIAQVDFYAGATFLGSDNSFPYSFSWTNVPAGNYALTATAFDTQFQGTGSDPVNITVDTIPVGNLEALLIVGNLSLNNGDQALKTRLETLGFNVAVVLASASTSADANGKNLVFISSTVNSVQVGNKFTSVSVPVINCEQALHDDLGMTSGSSGNSGSLANQTQINIIGTGHPLAASLPNSPVAVYTAAQTVTWGKPNNNAAKIATTMSSATQIVIFGYESGVAMVTGNAPARRVGFFLQDAGAAFLTASGTALLDAAITWAANSTPPPPNNPPSVSITNPLDGGIFLAPANIMIDATASDPDLGGSISKVEFYEGANLLSTDFDFPYSFIWNNVLQGNYQLTAKAFDNLNVSTTSSIVNVVVNAPANNPPTVSITNPLNGAIFNAPASITIDATASDADPGDNISLVEFYEGANLLGSDNSFPYSFNWNNIPQGNYQLTAKAFDNLNASTTSSIVNITVNGAPALGNILFVVGNLTLNSGDNAVKTRLETLGYSVTLKHAPASVAADATGKTAVIISSTINSTDVGNKFANVAVPLMNYEQALHDDLKMVSTAGGNSGTTANQTLLNIIGAGNPLAAGLPNGLTAVYSPAQTISWGKPGVNALKIATQAGNLNNIVIFGYETNSAMAGLNAPARRLGFFLQDVGAAFFTPNGTALFDAAINWLVSTPTPNNPPSVSITNPLNGAVFIAPASITVDATANDPDLGGSISKVEFYEGASLLATDFDFPYSFIWNNVPQGNYQLTAKAFDNLNVSTTSSIVNVVVNAPANNPPSVSITNPLNGAVFVAPASITIDATASDPDLGGSISFVEFYQGANLLGSDNSFPYSFNWNNVPQGNYQLTAKAFDNLNASTTSSIVNVVVNAPANNPPSVSITNPLNGAVFIAPASITIDATANDPDLGGSISLVEFYEGANLLGSDNSFPYSFNWTNVPQGNYQLTAKAFDNLNASGVSSIVNITVDAPANNPPSVGITNPLNGAVFIAPASITVDATANDPDLGGSISKVEFYEGANLLATDFDFPYSFNWNNVPQGNYQLTAKAFDNLNASTTSSIVNITVNQLPTVSITNPGNGAIFNAPANITIDATANDVGGSISLVEFYQGATLLGSDNSAPYSFNWNNVSAGNYQLTAKAFDNLNASATSAIVNITVNAVNQPPVVSITNPLNGASFSAPANVAIAATASDPDAGNTIAKVEFYVGNTLLGTDFTSPYSLNWNGVGNGTYQLKAKAFDNLNASAFSSIVTITVGAVVNQPPVVSMTNPLNGAVLVAPANITIDATASDPTVGGSISKVEFYQGVNLLGTDFTAPYQFVWNGVTAGSYQLTAKAFDNLNATTTSSIVNITVMNPASLTALYVVGNTTLNTGDAAVKAKLESMGYTVTVVGDAASTTADATGKTIVLISATVASGNVNTKFTTVAVPVINSEPGLMDDLKLTGTATTEYGSAFNQTQINIIGAGHPLAAGLPNGLTTVFNSVQTTIWGKPNGNAVSIATIAANATQVCIFGYQTGAGMFGINAPARRVGFMLADATPASLNTAGMQLLEAAILWAVGTTKNDEPVAAQERKSFEVNIYPNPSSGLINLELHNALEGKLSVGVYNQFGQEVRFAEQTLNNAFYREQFDLSTLPAGLYFVRVTNGETQLTRRLMIAK